VIIIQAIDEIILLLSTLFSLVESGHIEPTNDYFFRYIRFLDFRPLSNSIVEMEVFGCAELV